MALFDLFNKEAKEERLTQKALKDGEIYDCNILPKFEQMLEERKWGNAYKYVQSKEFIEDLSKIFKPYFPNDSRSKAESKRSLFINTLCSEYSKLYSNLSDYGSVQHTLERFDSFQEVPVEKYIKNGIFDEKEYELDKREYNPFLNYFQKANEVEIDLETTKELVDAYDDGLITDEDLFGLTNFKELFDGDFFDTNYLTEAIEEAKGAK